MLLAAAATAAVAQQPDATGAAGSKAAAKPAGAAEPGVVIVFDGSGSMWGRLEGDNKTNKLTVAREALRQPLSKPGLRTRVGLVSFGHRRKGDCGDIEVIAAPEAGPPERILEPLDKLNPRGKGPVANSLREAAKALAGTKPASIVLINDNADNCQQDACAVADEVAKANPGLSIHAIGIALEPDEAKRMACVARGAGKFVNAEDAGRLTAAIGDAMVASLRTPEAAPPAAGQQSAAATQAKDGIAAKSPSSPQGAPGVSSLGVSARLGANGPAVEQPLHWRIARAGETTPVFEGDGRELLRQLPAGKYDVEGRVGLVSARQSVSVPDNGPASLILPLEAGHVRYVLHNGKTVEGVAGAVVSLLPAAADGKASAPLLLSRAASGDLYVAPGSYVLAVDQGSVHRETKVTVAAGSSQGADFQLGAGRLAVFAQGQENGPPLDGAMFVVSADDPDAANGLREVARSGAAAPEFVLPTGSYQVTARLGTTEVRQRIAVSAGELVRAGIVLGLGQVQVTHTLDSASTKAGAPVLTRLSIVDGSGRPRVVARAQGPNPSFSLPAGRYRVESEVGEQNARVAADIDLKPGSLVTVAMRIDTGQLAMKPAGAAVPAAGDTLWEIRDAKGQVVWRTIQPEPRALLLPGRYVVRAEVRGRASEQTVDVAAGEARTISAQQ